MSVIIDTSRRITSKIKSWKFVMNEFAIIFKNFSPQNIPAIQ